MTINDADENQWLVDTFDGRIRFNGQIDYSSSRAWIGLNDLKKKGYINGLQENLLIILLGMISLEHN